MRILAMDLSLTASGWALAIDGKIENSGLLPSRDTGVARLIYVRNRACEKADTLKPDLVVFEDLAFTAKGSAVHEHAGLAFMIRSEMFQDQKPYVLVATSSLKRFVCGSGGGPKNPVKKEHMLKFLATRFGHDVNDNNVCDAIGLAYLGMALVGDWECRIDAQREVIKKIRESNPWLRYASEPVEPIALWE